LLALGGAAAPEPRKEGPDQGSKVLGKAPDSPGSAGRLPALLPITTLPCVLGNERPLLGLCCLPRFRGRRSLFRPLRGGRFRSGASGSRPTNDFRGAGVASGGDSIGAWGELGDR